MDRPNTAFIRTRYALQRDTEQPCLRQISMNGFELVCSAGFVAVPQQLPLATYGHTVMSIMSLRQMLYYNLEKYPPN